MTLHMPVMYAAHLWSAGVYYECQFVACHCLHQLLNASFTLLVELLYPICGTALPIVWNCFTL